MEIYSHSPEGYEGDLVKVDTDLRRGIPGYDVTGMAGTAVKEARERVRAALRNSGFLFPQERILTNLSPSDIRKSGAGFDLAMALSLLSKTGQVDLGSGPLMALGELQLDGEVRPVPGVLSAAIQARKAGIPTLWVSRENAREAALPKGIQVMVLERLSDLRLPLCPFDPDRHPGNYPVVGSHQGGGRIQGTEFVPGMPDQLKGQPRVKRALEAAAAGGHNLLLLGPPGSGKTLAARTLKSLLPPWNPEEAMETTRIWSLAGRRESRQGLLEERPFRSPHHSSSAEGLLGGGSPLRPGEISLAHKGVLFLDEAAEFRSDLLQGLREPLEEGAVQVTRAGRSCRFPADFQLVLAANPCPCGQTGREEGWCSCSPVEKGAYIRRIGGALLDRLDLRLEVRPVKAEALLKTDDAGELLSYPRICRARDRIKERKVFPGVFNSRLSLRALEEIPEAGKDAYRIWSKRPGLAFSARGLLQVWRTALTLRDLENEDVLRPRHLEEAWELRGGSGGEFGWF